MHNVARNKGFWLLVLATAVVAGVLSYFAYDKPDALEYSLDTYAPAESGPAEGSSAAEASSTDSYTAPLQDYSVPGIGKPHVSGGLAGVIGAAVTFIVVVGLGALLNRRSTKAAGGR